MKMNQMEINGALGLIQLPKLERFNQVRLNVFQKLQVAFEPLIKNGDLVVMQQTPGVEMVPFSYPVQCRDKKTRIAFSKHLHEYNIDTRPIVCGNMARQPVFTQVEHRIIGELVGANKVMDQGLYWGLHPNFNDTEVNYIINAVKVFFKS